MTLQTFAMQVVALLYKHRGSISSWGRTYKHNADVGGVPNSWHLLFMGCDIVLDVNVQNSSFVTDAKLMGLLALWEGDHYHLQPIDWPH